MLFYAGSVRKIALAPGAQASWDEAEKGVPPNKSACKAQLRALLMRLADVGRLKSPEQFRHEGDEIYAVKARCGLRAYGFWAPGGYFVVAHLVLKKKDKLDPNDKAKALAAKAKWKGL